MYNFDPFNALLAIATNIPVILKTGLVLQGYTFLFTGFIVIHSYMQDFKLLKFKMCYSCDMTAANFIQCQL